LRFSSTLMRNLIRGVESGFENLGEIEDIEPRLEGGPRKESMIHENKHGLPYHTFVYEGYRFGGSVSEEEILPLHMALNRYVRRRCCGWFQRNATARQGRSRF
jgi:hypothetical protein